MTARIEAATTRIADAVERVPKVGEVGTRASRALHRAVLGGGETARDTVDVLHGTWLGHPLHPVLTDFAIGAWFFGGFFDAMGAIRHSRSARQMGDTLAAAGTAVALPTAVTGLADFTTLPRPAAKPGSLHAMLNVASVGLYAASLVQRRRGRQSQGLALSFAAQGLLLASAWLGGMLVYDDLVGVDHSERFTGPREWTPVLDETELPERTPKRVELEGKGVLLYRADGRIYAIGSVCSHFGGPLEKGHFQDTCVQCPWHDSVFDLRNGRVVHGPATRPQVSFLTRIHDGRVELRLGSALNESG
ncbi:MAG TPA: Rieske 2Fe-2S domain-containing protein [Gemmatimonadales bacterium]|nr:Rieske 2Fe-2S domain-containing protein [Gemmatimonadales bacterium]